MVGNVSVSSIFFFLLTKNNTRSLILDEIIPRAFEAQNRHHLCKTYNYKQRC